MSDDRGRRAARERATARPELRSGEFYFDVPLTMPINNRTCTVIVTDGIGPQYKLPFPVVLRDGHWFNPRYGETQLTVRVIKWRYAT